MEPSLESGVPVKSNRLSLGNVSNNPKRSPGEEREEKNLRERWRREEEVEVPRKEAMRPATVTAVPDTSNSTKATKHIITSIYNNI